MFEDSQGPGTSVDSVRKNHFVLAQHPYVGGCRCIPAMRNTTSERVSPLRFPSFLTTAVLLLFWTGTGSPFCGAHVTCLVAEQAGAKEG
jgi:hypothetical protein